MRRHRVSGDTWKINLVAVDRPLSFQNVITLWRDNKPFQSFWTATLQNIPFEAYCWETPRLTRDTLTWPFECVFVNSPALAATKADPAPFEEHFDADSNSAVVCFENLGADALLVVPTPQAAPAAYSHLAQFVREAPAAHVGALWPAVSKAVEARLDEQPLWLSTAGLGVFWLHVRLDDTPKYYRHLPYTNPL